MRAAILCLLPLALTACGSGLTPEEQRSRDDADIASVEALQEPQLVQLDPEPIRYPDIERENLYGAGCAFAPKGGGLGAIALAKASAGYMKIDGEIIHFAPDPGSAELPLGARHKYTSETYSFTLKLSEAEGVATGPETSNFAASLTVSDAKDRTVFDAQGIAQCGV